MHISFPIYTMADNNCFLKRILDRCRSLHILHFKKRKFSLRKAYECERKHLGKDRLHIFHTIEFYTLIFGLAIFYELFFFFLVGITLHQLIDVSDVIIFPYKKGWRANSIYYWINRH